MRVTRYKRGERYEGDKVWDRVTDVRVTRYKRGERCEGDKV